MQHISLAGTAYPLQMRIGFISYGVSFAAGTVSHSQIGVSFATGTAYHSRMLIGFMGPTH